MKTRLCVVLITLVTVVFLTSCQPVSSVEAPTMGTTEKSMKGYELYSWQAEDGWHFSLLMGTNRLKTIDEVTAPSVDIKSVAELRSRLAQLAPGEEVIWTIWTDERLALPPQAVIEEVKQACRELGLEFTIAS